MDLKNLIKKASMTNPTLLLFEAEIYIVFLKQPVDENFGTESFKICFEELPYAMYNLYKPKVQVLLSLGLDDAIKNVIDKCVLCSLNGIVK